KAPIAATHQLARAVDVAQHRAQGRAIARSEAEGAGDLARAGRLRIVAQKRNQRLGRRQSLSTRRGSRSPFRLSSRLGAHKNRPQTRVPAKAGIHQSAVLSGDRWVPAFAGTRSFLQGVLRSCGKRTVALVSFSGPAYPSPCRALASPLP